MASTTIKGLDQVMRNLNKEIDAIEGRTLEGLIAAAIFVRGEAQEITPVDQGVLINTAFIDSGETSRGASARVGYTAKYAPYVHEMPASYNFTKPGTGPKFLEKAANNNTQEIVGIIQRRARIT